MAYCQKCGNEISDYARKCEHCGAEVKVETYSGGTNSNDTGNFGWSLLGFCIPIVGLLLFLVWKDEQPKNAKAAGKGALTSVVLYVLFYVIIILFAGLSAFAGY